MVRLTDFYYHIGFGTVTDHEKIINVEREVYSIYVSFGRKYCVILSIECFSFYIVLNVQ